MSRKRLIPPVNPGYKSLLIVLWALKSEGKRFGWVAFAFVGLFLSLADSASAALYQSTYNSGFANSGNIPDGNPSGWSDSRSLSGITDFSITDVQVKLNVSGGYNGDLYAYLSHNGVLVPLLNRVGVTATGGGNSFGYSDTGFNVTLSDSGAYDIHFYGSHSPTLNGNGQLTGTWQADGRNINPASSPATFDSASRVGFSSYDDLNPNGSWTLFFADMSGGEQSQLLSWELDISAVPEPVNVALMIFGTAAAIFALISHRTKSRHKLPSPEFQLVNQT